ncbi:MAG TPA: class I SAM-dependent methyltransferase [Nitrososphaerales archaeon]|nr:class I SAM-dependent methyltransferase [Nitrososphaerales archaeon]
MAGDILQYGELAKYYDLLYSWKDYDREARVITGLIKRYKASPGNSLLDVGCGTGKHIQHLAARFDCVGLDASEEMLEQARSNAKGVKFVRGNMVNFELGKKFDVVLCLFSSIGYVRTYPRLARTLRNFARHLSDGGVVIIEPWFTKSTVKDGYVHVLVQGNDDLKVVRVDITSIRGNLSVLDERIVVAEPSKGMATYKDRMVMGLFEKDEFLRIMRQAGLRATYVKKSLAPGRGLYIGTKPTG